MAIMILRYVTMIGGHGNDYIENWGPASFSLIDGGDGNDILENSGSNSTVTGGEGDDSIGNGADSVILYGDVGNDYIHNQGDSWYGNYVTMEGGDGDDSIVNNNGGNILINAGDGDDYVENGGNNVTIKTDSGNDTIINDQNIYRDISIMSGEGDDLIENNTTFTTINAGDGNNTINNYNRNNLIIADTGNATIKNEGLNLTVQTGDSSDFVRILNGNITVNANTTETFDSLPSTVGSFNSLISLLVSLGNGDDTIQNADSYVSIQVGDGNKIIENYGENVVFMLGNGQQTLKNDGSGATIKAEENSGADNIIINEGENSVIDVSNIKSVVINGVDFTDEENQVSANDFNSAVIQMETEAQNFYQNIFSDDATLRSIFENGVNSPYLSFLNENSNSVNACVLKSSNVNARVIESVSMNLTSSNNGASYSDIDTEIQKANALANARQKKINDIGYLLNDIGLFVNGLEWTADGSKKLKNMLDSLKNLETNLSKFESTSKFLSKTSGVLSAANAYIADIQFILAKLTLKETESIYNEAVDTLLENYSSENLNKVKAYADKLEKAKDNSVLTDLSLMTSNAIGIAFLFVGVTNPVTLTIGAVLALNSILGNWAENEFYKHALNTNIGNFFSNLFGKPLNSNNRHIRKLNL